ncbi:MAG TPA: GNAT family N-acetyltransferase [Acidimicrobiia bacterium]|nr:GNAT family N-acetyltransferase [Acidimicrobiia bacterium]
MAASSVPGSPFTIRRAEPADFDAYIDAFEAVAAEGRWMGAEAPMDRDARRPAFDRAIAGDGAVLYLALAGDVIVGGIHAFLGGGVVDLGMFVAAGRRGGGVGSALLEAVIAWARQQNAHKISLAAWTTNHAAIGLYARYGFRVEGTRRRHYRRRSGALWDSVVMGLVLDEESAGGPGAGSVQLRPPIVLPDAGLAAPLGSGGGRLVVRELHRSDIPALVAAVAKLEGRQWLVSIPYPYTAEHAEEWVAATRVALTAGTAAELAVFLDDALVGSVGLRLLGPDDCSGEIGYWVANEARRRGVATAATRLLCDFGFGRLGLRRIELNAAVANVASRRVAEKAGFELEGVRRAWRTVAGVPTDHCLYSRIAGQA